ncbi:MAG: FAD-dependent oxidoreductase [Gemmatimonadota bacterium]
MARAGSNGNGNGKVGAVAVVGAGIAGMQASLDLAETGYKVYLIERSSGIGGRMAQLDKTFPTNDCAMCTISPRLVDCEKHANIEILTNAEVLSTAGEAGAFELSVLKHPTYVDREKCNACGDCEAVCPVSLPDGFNQGLGQRKVIHKLYPQTIPNVYTIDKGGLPPCRLTCPAGVNVQGYVALVGQRQYREAVSLIKERHPLPSVCGRVCHHPCEFKCNRREIDEPVAVNALKRFAADRERQRRRDEGAGPELPPVAPAKGRKVAVVGSGPAGLAAAHDLAQDGYGVTVFEAAPVAGGMLRLGIPEYRLPRDVLDEEIADVLAVGIELKLNTPIGPDLTLQNLREQGYEAVFLAVGAQKSRALNLEGADRPGVLQGVDFLRAANLGQPVELGRRVLVIGGGNVAVDVAQTAVRLGAEEVHLACLESREQMPAHSWEIEDAVEEKIVFHCGLGPKRFLGNGNGNGRDSGPVTGLETLVCSSVFDADGRFNPTLEEGTEAVLEADTVIVAIGQASDLAFLGEEGAPRRTRRGTLEADPLTLQTSVPWLFAGGDVVLGPASAVQAVAQGHEAAESIKRYLEGADLAMGRQRPEQTPAGVPPRKFELQPRQQMARLGAAERVSSFVEIEQGFTEEQAVAEAKRCLNCGICSECLQCVAACQAGAICHDMREEVVSLDVGAVIMAPGFDCFDPQLRGEYGYGRYANVMTSIEFERLLSASGPTGGTVQRPSDGAHPVKVAWIQCVGSRDTVCGNGYCSSVCCMYATKEAFMAREHDARIQPTIFYNDIRAFGKGFERYYDSARAHGVRYVKSIASTVKELQRSKNLLLQHAAEDGTVTEEEFDLVVLSVGLTPSAPARELARRLDVELDHYGFVKTGKFSPNQTSRPGVFVCGAFEEPMDIPESVTGASSTAALAGELLAEARGTLVEEHVYPEERDVARQEPRVGVFICHCGMNIARTVDVEQVVEYAGRLPHVAHAEHNLYTCSTDAQRHIIDAIVAHGLNRVVVASCTPRTHEPLFRDMMKEAGLNPYLFEMTNIRDQCSWVHADFPAAATEKAKDLARMAVARASTLEPLHDMSFEVSRTGLVIGGGLAGMTAALSLAGQGFPVVLVEKEAELGGRLRHLRYTLSGEDPAACLRDLLARIEAQPLVTVYTDADIVGFSGHVGKYTTRILTGSREVEVEHGALIVASGAVGYEPTEYLYGEDPRIVTQTELEERLGGGQPGDPPGEVVMIQCVGSRDEEHPYCSRVCCGHAVKNALRLKAQWPDTQVYVFYRDIRTYGEREDYYRQAREAGVLFIRYEPEAPPQVTLDGGQLRVVGRDPVLGAEVELRPGLLVLSAGIRPHPESADLALRLKAPLNADGNFLEAHLKLRPLDFSNEGMFLCGLAHSPKYAEESIAQARGAAARAATILSKRHLFVPGTVAHVHEEKCAACLTCVRACPFDVPVIKDGVAFIEMSMCQGCGTCAAACPGKAIELGHFADRQIIAAVQEAGHRELPIVSA